MSMTTGRDKPINLPAAPDEDQLHMHLDRKTGGLMVVNGEQHDVIVDMDLFAPPTVFTALSRLADENQTGREMTEEQRVHAAFWSGYFYAEAMTR